MGLSVIGAGYGRTGTLSLKSALEHLGYNKCHHMIEVINHPGEAEKWMAAIDNPVVNWEALFKVDGVADSLSIDALQVKPALGYLMLVEVGENREGDHSAPRACRNRQPQF